MGMYTQVVLNFEVKKNEILLELLANKGRYMNNEMEYEEFKSLMPDHSFFSRDRWTMVVCNLEYKISEDCIRLKYDNDFKNYGSELELFLDFISPHIINDNVLEFLGYKQYEEDVFPTLIYKDETKKDILFSCIWPSQHAKFSWIDMEYLLEAKRYYLSKED